jgi:hypothetical protein
MNCWSDLHTGDAFVVSSTNAADVTIVGGFYADSANGIRVTSAAVNAIVRVIGSHAENNTSANIRLEGGYGHVIEKTQIVGDSTTLYGAYINNPESNYYQISCTLRNNDFSSHVTNDIYIGSSAKNVTLYDQTEIINGLNVSDSGYQTNYPSAAYISTSSTGVTTLHSAVLSSPLAVSSGGTGLTSTSQNFIFAGPTSGSGAPTFRALTAGDIPSLSGTYMLLSGTNTSTAVNTWNGTITGTYQTFSPTFTGSGIGVLLQFSPTFSNTGAARVINSSPTISGTGVTTLVGVQAGLTLAASASMTNYYGLDVTPPSLGASATITGNAYGVYVSAIATTGIANAYGIFQAGASDLNTFAGSTTFSGVAYFTNASGAAVAASTAATSSNNYASPSFAWNSNFWTGSASSVDQWYFGTSLGTGSNPTSTLTLSHAGSTGAATFTVTSALTATGAFTNTSSYSANFNLTTSSVGQQAAIGITNVCSNAAAGYGVAARVTTTTTNPLLAVFYGQILTATGAGTTTQANGLYIDSPSLASGSTVTTLIGIDIQPQFVSGKTTTAYGIYQSGSSDLNQFSGVTTFSGTVTSSPTLAANGNAITVTPNVTNTTSGGTTVGINVQGTVNSTGTAVYDSIFSQVIMGASKTLSSYAAGLSVGSPVIGSGATVPTMYGLYIAAQAATGITGTAYGINQAGASDQNFFNGTTQIVGTPGNGTALTVNPTFTTTSGAQLGINTSVTVNSTGATYANVVYAQANINASKSVTNNIAAFVAGTPSMGSGATSPYSYGLYINPQNATGVTTSYGIYQAGASDLNYFAGKVSGSMGGWQTYTPTATPGGSMTLSSTSFPDAEYLTVGPITFFKFTFNFTAGGTANFSIGFTLPVTAGGTGTNYNAMFTANYFNGTNWTTAFSYMNNGSSTIMYVQPNAGANFAIGSGQEVCVNGFYRTS